MDNDQNIFEEFSKEVKDRFISIVKKEAKQFELTTGEVAMLFYWQNHRDEPRFKFLSKFINQPANVDQKALNKPKRRYKSKRR